MMFSEVQAVGWRVGGWLLHRYQVSYRFQHSPEKVGSGVDTKRTAKAQAYIINRTKMESCLKRHGLFNTNAT